MLCDDTATENTYAGNIFDYQIFDATSTGNNYFNYISTCLSADLSNGSQINSIFTGTYGSNTGGSGNIVGIPYAWTHGASLSTNGYSSSDTGPYCYIGFPWGSAALSQYPQANFPTTTYCEFVSDFFYYALTGRATVNQALDAASELLFNTPWYNTALCNDFVAYWPGCNPSTSPGCTMVVYGNGNIYLYPGGPDYVTPPSLSDNVPSPSYINQEYEFTAVSTDPYPGTSISYTFNWGDGSPNTQTINVNSGTQVVEYHEYSQPEDYNVIVTAKSSNGVVNMNEISVIIDPYIVVNAYDQYDYPVYPNVWIDGTDYGAAPVCVPVSDGYHTVTVDSTVWDPWLGCELTTFNYMEENNDNYYYTTTASIPVYANAYVNVYYSP